MPAVSEKQRRFLAADRDRKLKGQKTKTGMSLSQLTDFLKVRKK